mmetsp:Transcript_13084/g.29744  ORF Transcript_13084/g.29744 Transcript_13084/m.29744 type:complete len:355 (+) Transcript_13084:73-1137(+)
MPPKATAKGQSSTPAAKPAAAPKAKAAVAAPKADAAKAKATAAPKAEAALKVASKGGPPPKAGAVAKPKASSEKPASAAGSGAAAAKALAQPAEAAQASDDLTEKKGDEATQTSKDEAAMPDKSTPEEKRPVEDVEQMKPHEATKSEKDKPLGDSELDKVGESKAQVEEKTVEEAAQPPKADNKAQRAADEELQRLAGLANGEVTVRYEMYSEKFPIENHRLLAATVDELYCLSDVMPGCFIHLSDKEYIHGEERTYVKEDPAGTFLGLMAGETYWCVVEQDAEQEKKDQERMKKVWAGGVSAGVGDRGSEGETCSCGWGAPCTNPMICKDWDNRFANAIKAGGNPILFNTTAS